MYLVLGFSLITLGFYSLCKFFFTQLIELRNDHIYKKFEFKKFRSKINAVTTERQGKDLQFPKWHGFRNFIIAKKIIENSNCVSLYLEPEDKKEIQKAKAGQYLTLKMLPFGEIKSVNKSYSISSIDENNQYRITIKKFGVFSNYLYDSISSGEKLQCKMPAGEFVLDNENTPIVFIAGGIGITPILSMLQEVTKTQKQRLVYLFWGVSTLGDVILSEDFETLADKNSNLKLNLFISHSSKRVEQKLETSEHPTIIINGKKHLLDKEENLIDILSAKLSFIKRKNQWFIRDLASSKDIFLNGKLISGIKASWRSFELKNGDKIKIEDQEIIFNNHFNINQKNSEHPEKRDKLSIKNFTLHKGRMSKTIISEFIDAKMFNVYLSGPASMIEEFSEFGENIKIECFDARSEEASYQTHKRSSLH